MPVSQLNESLMIEYQNTEFSMFNTFWDGHDNTNNINTEENVVW